MSKPDLQREIDAHLVILRSLRKPSGLFLAAASDGVSTGYDKSWLRDNFYEVLALEELGLWEESAQTWHALLDIFLKHESKINWAINERPRYTYQYIHARYNPETFEEFWEEWGNKQNDAVGCILYAVGKRELEGHSVVRDDNDKRVIGRLVKYLDTIEYWHDPDNGIWEEYEEVHASSVGACIAGLQKIDEAGLAEVPRELISKGFDALHTLLPRESHTKFADLAQLSLMYPYDLLTREEEDVILSNIEYHLARDKGVIRYKNDRYYNANQDGWSEEAEWTMGFSWLSIIYRTRGEHDKADFWLEEARKSCDPDGKLPELYFSHTDAPNENNPLGWSESLYIIACNRAR